MKKNNSIQEWIPFEKILENGIIKLKDNSYIKIIKIYPINFNLKSELEKEAILNSYKIFLKTCDFNFQILIQSKKEDLSKHFSKIKKINSEEENNIKKYSENYIKYIEDKNKKSKASSKNYYIIIKEDAQKNVTEKIFIDKLNEKYLKIKECLSRCGNKVEEIDKKEEVEKILYSFLNTRKEIIDLL